MMQKENNKGTIRSWDEDDETNCWFKKRNYGVNATYL